VSFIVTLQINYIEIKEPPSRDSPVLGPPEGYYLTEIEGYIKYQKAKRKETTQPLGIKTMPGSLGMGSIPCSDLT